MTESLFVATISAQTMQNFQVLKSVVDSHTLSQMCAEMDTVMARCAPHTARGPGATRYCVGGASSDTTARALAPTLNRLIESLLYRHLDSADFHNSFTAYVRQTASSGLHLDANPGQGPSYTLLVPLRHVDSTDYTIVFDHSAQSPHTNYHTAMLEAERRARSMSVRDDIVDQQRLHHMPKWVNRLPITGIFRYRLGDAVLFNAHLLHGSNDWKGLNPHRQHKDYVLVHALHNSSKTYDETA